MRMNRISKAMSYPSGVLSARLLGYSATSSTLAAAMDALCSSTRRPDTISLVTIRGKFPRSRPPEVICRRRCIWTYGVLV